jgi:hypothetical protein
MAQVSAKSASMVVVIQEEPELAPAAEVAAASWFRPRVAFGELPDDRIVCVLAHPALLFEVFFVGATIHTERKFPDVEHSVAAGASSLHF